MMMIAVARIITTYECLITAMLSSLLGIAAVASITVAVVWFATVAVVTLVATVTVVNSASNAAVGLRRG